MTLQSPSQHQTDGLSRLIAGCHWALLLLLMAAGAPAAGNPAAGAPVAGDPISGSPLTEDSELSPAAFDAYRRSLNHGEWWQRGWTTIYSLGVLVNGWQGSEADSDEDRFDARVSAITAATGLYDVLMNPLPHTRVDPSPNRSDFRLMAESELKRRAWRARIGSFLVNGTAGLVIALGDDRPEDGLIQLALGTLSTELRILTLPSAASQYRQNVPGSLTFGVGKSAVTWVPTVGVGRQGLLLHLAF